jgi:hypothetical protein
MNINGNITFVSAVKSQLLTSTAHTLDSCSAFLKNETLDKAVPKQCGCYILAMLPWMLHSICNFSHDGLCVVRGRGAHAFLDPLLQRM